MQLGKFYCKTFAWQWSVFPSRSDSIEFMPRLIATHASRARDASVHHERLELTCRFIKVKGRQA